LGGIQTYQTLRDSVVDLFSGRREKKKKPDFWALRDVSFELKEGEVLGIVGRNGAGKSTLLKLLSRITTPDTGFIEVHGRIGSLLEVGTGFHPELSGRENVFMNGILLGMTRKEVERKFDEIVAFSGVEEFLDTPVKRYSSGMRVRLGFAVAAYLDPEILVVDEVLAVGDAEFQRKCIGRMNEVASKGRTVLFVSHQLEVIQNLCSRAILIEEGRLVLDSSPELVISKYLSKIRNTYEFGDGKTMSRKGKGEMQIVRITVSEGRQIRLGESLELKFLYLKTKGCPRKSIRLRVIIRDEFDRTVANLSTEVSNLFELAENDKGIISCFIPKVSLNAGHYSIDYVLRINGEIQDAVRRALAFEILPGDFFGNGRSIPGPYLLDQVWTEVSI